MIENLKFEVTNYLKELYNPKGVAHSGNGDDDDGGGGKEKDLEVTPSCQLRKTRHHYFIIVGHFEQTKRLCILGGNPISSRNHFSFILKSNHMLYNHDMKTWL